ncbi:hypothetical protein LCGC14_3054080, partial [marine sediment metagenome]
PEGPQFVLAYKDIARLRTYISEDTFGKTLNNAQRLGVDVSHKLDEAVRKSFASYSGELNQIRQEAFQLQGQFSTTYPRELRLALEGVTQIKGEVVAPQMQQLVSESLGSKQATDLMVKALGGKEPAKEFFLTDLFNKATDASGNINFEEYVKAITLSRQSGGAAALMTSKQFSALKNYFIRAQNILPESVSGNRITSTFQGRLTNYSTFAAARNVLGGALASAAVSLGAGLGTRVAFSITPKSLVRGILLDPKKAGQFAMMVDGSFNNTTNKKILLELLGTKGLFYTIRIQNRNKQWQTLSEDTTLGDNPSGTSSPVPPIR